MRRLCRAMKISRSSYLTWKAGNHGDRSRSDFALLLQIRAIHTESRGTYGSPRIVRGLRHSGVRVGRRRVARLMGASGLAGTPRRRFKLTTQADPKNPVANNLLNRQFTVNAPNQAWATDITAIRTVSGWLYLSVVLDLYARKVVGWAADTHMRAELCIDALKQAIHLRQPGTGLLHHSDRGSQYTSESYQTVLQSNGMVCSMSRVGDCWDNAVSESFFGTLKIELIHRQLWATPQMAKEAVADYIHKFYNPVRLHSSNGYFSPNKCEYRFQQQLEKAA